MKRFLIALAVFALVWPGARQTDAAEVSIDFFYNHLGDEGSWVEVGDYGYCWQPNVAVNNTGWRPYTDGYWAYTDVGWTWVSYESFGWATYHYGRWARLADYGWVWVPGTEWGPAWVSWRTGGDYVGWAPLPPRRGYTREYVYDARPIAGPIVDIEFDIGPAYYNFVDVRYIGEPVLRQRIFEPTQNITYINQTVNVTNITYNNNTVYNYGPDYDRLSAYSTRPIQRLRLERAANVDPMQAAQSGALTRVQGDRLVVGAPQRFERVAQQAAPKVVKKKLEKPNLETGWMGISDPQVKAKLQEKIKTEDPKTVPPPQVQPVNPAALADRNGKKDKKDKTDADVAQGPAAGSSPPVMDAAAGGPSDNADDKGKGKNKRGDRAAQLPASLTGVPNDPSAPQAADGARGRGADKRERRDGAGEGEPRIPRPDAVAANPGDAGASQDVARGKNKEGKEGKKQRDAAERLTPGQQPQPGAPAEFTAPPALQDSQQGGAAIPQGRDKAEKRDKGEGRKRDADAPQPPAQMQTIPQEVGRGRGAGEEQAPRKFDRMPRPQPPQQQPPPGIGQGDGGRSAGGAQPQAAPEQPRGGKGKGEKEGKEKKEKD